MSDVYIVGYYGKQNLGDNALLNASALGAEVFWHSKSLRVSTVRPLQLNGFSHPQTIKDEQSFKGQNRLLNYLHGVRADRILVGGGSVFHTAQDINIKRHLIKLSRSGRLDALGVSLGPFADQQGELACKRFLDEATFVGVRDFQSMQIAKSLSPNANVKLTFDLAPSLAVHPNFPVPAANDERRGMAVCLCHTPQAYTKVSHIAKALLETYQETGEPITLVDFNGHPTHGDHAIHLQVLKQLDGLVPVTHVVYQDDPIKTLRLLSKQRLTLAMRLHAAVFSYMVHTPFLSLNYHPKCNGWCQQIGQAEPLTMQLEDIESNTLSKAILAQFVNPNPVPALPVDQAVQLSLNNWRSAS